MRNTLKILKEKPHYLNGLIFLLILNMTIILYWQCHDNYFFSDDFEWLARGILAQHLPNAPAEITRIEGRDFNPVFIILLTIMLRLFGLSPLAFRLLSLLTFTLFIFMFYYILSRYFQVNRLISLSAALISGLNMFVSEVVLNMSALVYTLSLLLFLVGLKFFSDGKRLMYFLFLSLAFLTKETIILAVIPLIFYETKKKNRWFIIKSFTVLVLSRGLLQWIAAVPGKYSSFMSVSHFFYKLYFISIRSLGISPYAINPIVGAGILIILTLGTGYFVFFKKIKNENTSVSNCGYKAAEENKRGLLYFFLAFAGFVLFFSLLPKLTSRYFFYPSFSLWGIAALWANYFFNQNKKIKYALIPLLFISLIFNHSLIKREIEDYKILGNFSQQFIQQQAAIIKNNSGTGEIILYKQDSRPLGNTYQWIKKRENLPKLLPFREHSLGGIIDPGHLIPIVFYPGKIVHWHLIKETPDYFIGRLEISSGERNPLLAY